MDFFIFKQKINDDNYFLVAIKIVILTLQLFQKGRYFMKITFSNMFVTLALVSSFALASCKSKEASTHSNDNSFEVNVDKSAQTNKEQNMITADKPFISEDLSIEASTETIKSTVYFLVNDLKPVWGIDQYKTKGTDFTVFANLNDKVVPIILTGSKDGKHVVLGI